MPGHLYFLANPTIPGLTKIGFTESVLSKRFAALQSTGVAAPFVLLAAFRVEDPRSCEKAVHAALADVRESDDREFFRVGVKEALTKVMPLVLAHMADSSKGLEASEEMFSDLSGQDRDWLAGFTMAPSTQRPHNWEWLERLFSSDELTGRDFFHRMKQLGYLREVRGARGVAFGLVARKDPEYQEFFGDEGFFRP